MKRASAVWSVYALVSAAVCAALILLTCVMIDVERGHLRARRDASTAEQTHLVLTEMDSWIAPLLAVESARAPREYAAVYEDDQHLDRTMNKLPSGAVLTRSPLATFRSDYIRLHLEFAPEGTVSSPEVGADAMQQAYLAGCVTPEQSQSNRAELTRVAASESYASLRQRVLALTQDVEARAAKWAAAPPTRPAEGGGFDFAVRSQTLQFARNSEMNWFVNNPGPEDTQPPLLGPVPDYIGPMVSLWSGPSRGDLWFLRVVRVAGMEKLQGCLMDWPAVRRALAQLYTLRTFPDGMTPEPVATSADRIGEDEQRSAMTALPVRVAWNMPPAEYKLSGPVLAALATLWGTCAAALIAAAVLLRGTLSLAEKRARFASAVTHELRSPLTTFRLYTEMLADGVVSEEGKRKEYIETLERESARLARLVENVLSYSRVEEGRAVLDLRPITPADLWSRLAPALERRASQSDMILIAEGCAAPAPAAQVDADAIGQVLFNLVDNACKYASRAERREIRVAFRTEPRVWIWIIRDFGPGVPPRVRRAIFRPFDRGGLKEVGAATGVGLGLALARGLAREMQGSVELVGADGAGAMFELRVRATPT